MFLASAREVMTMIEGVLLDLIGYADSSSSALLLLLLFSFVLASNTKEIQPHILHNYTVYGAIISIKQRVITSFPTPYGN